MGVAVFAGMLGVTFFGLFLTPVFYVLLRTLAKRFEKPKHAHAHAHPHETAPKAVGGDEPALEGN
jgi:multidrug efflux pump